MAEITWATVEAAAPYSVLAQERWTAEVPAGTLLDALVDLADAREAPCATRGQVERIDGVARILRAELRSRN